MHLFMRIMNYLVTTNNVVINEYLMHFLLVLTDILLLIFHFPALSVCGPPE